MKTTILKEDLAKALNLVSRIVSPRPSLPVLNNVLLSVTKEGVTLSATNLETSIKVKAPAKTSLEGSTTVPAKVFGEFINSLKEEKLDLVLEKENLEVVGEATKAQLATINPLEFPALPEIRKEETEVLESAELVEAINQVVFAASVDEARPILTGVLLREEKGGLLFVATDGYRLAKKETKIKTNLKEMVVPAKSLLEVAKLITEMGEEEIRLGLLGEKNQVVFVGNNFELSTRVLDGAFPNFEQIVPKKLILETKLDREGLSEAVRQTAVLAKDLGSVVQIEAKPGKEIVLSAKTAQLGQATTRLSGEVSGEAVSVALNSRFLLEGLSNFKAKEISFDLSGATSPALLSDKKDPSFIYIVMPVRVQG
ncbi:MAG: DNA polymerase III subunit beta [bacterium]|nr:DNA polymerase III subunit beta [bacterium]